jgi:hypothetical protein
MADHFTDFGLGFFVWKSPSARDSDRRNGTCVYDALDSGTMRDFEQPAGSFDV